MPVLIGLTLTAWLITLWCVVAAVRARSGLRAARRLAMAAGWGALGIAAGACLVLVQAFQAFSGDTLVARVTTKRLAPDAFELTYSPVGSGKGDTARARGKALEALQRVPLRGDQWSVSGGVIKWHPWLTALGLRSYHRPMRISGQFSDLSRQRAAAPTVVSLAKDVDWLWERFYWADPYLPWVDAVYGSSAYAYVEPQAIQEIYVTPSGYLIKRAPP
jgi:hypothetical protein